jgi:hypothetical protein
MEQEMSADFEITIRSTNPDYFFITAGLSPESKQEALALQSFFVPYNGSLPWFRNRNTQIRMCGISALRFPMFS